MSVARKRTLPKADDFFGGAEPETVDEPLAKTREEEPAAEAEESAEETIAEGRRLMRKLEELGDEGDEQVAAMIAAAKKTEKAMERMIEMQEADRYRRRVVPPAVTEKVTFYLPPEQVRQLEVVKLALLLEHNLKVTRSQIMEALAERMQEQIGEIVAYLEPRAE